MHRPNFKENPMNTTTLKPKDSSPPVAWWRVPHMWLVLGLPTVAVVGSITAAVIAVVGADPVLDKAAYERDRYKVPAHLQGQERMDALIRMQPARHARNNAAAPVIASED